MPINFNAYSQLALLGTFFSLSKSLKISTKSFVSTGTLWGKIDSLGLSIFPSLLASDFGVWPEISWLLLLPLLTLLLVGSLGEDDGAEIGVSGCWGVVDGKLGVVWIDSCDSSSLFNSLVASSFLICVLISSISGGTVHEDCLVTTLW